ncbi:hypothetical protein Acr_01g0007430 [Actinidia rufa]|uniref:Uncharacterized protein n=1 Tax=Actinidia rufa TaxID=165716 RepID=A0A7J0E361_9ERIC|nr:hypothetical protein Acr_01g0007430 [Actinidia rufa]
MVMGKNKKNKGGGSESATRSTDSKIRAIDVEDPIRAEALARPNVSSRAAAAPDKPMAGSLNTALLPIQICPKSREGKPKVAKAASMVPPEEDSEEDVPVADSDDISRSLGDEDSLCAPSVRQNAGEDITSSVVMLLIQMQIGLHRNPTGMVNVPPMSAFLLAIGNQTME